jgi:four helix bundle protein
MAKQYDLEDRTATFATRVRDFVKRVPKDLTNTEYSKQLIRSSSSVGANYIEANEALSRKDFLMRIKISRKEAKESRYWLRLIIPAEGRAEEQEHLIQEATELLMIFTAILKKSQNEN